jgi:hypothetical protein
MPSVDAVSKTLGEHLLFLCFLCYKIELWNNGAIGWGIMSCIFGLAFPFRKFLAKRLVLFTAPTPKDIKKYV